MFECSTKLFDFTAFPAKILAKVLANSHNDDKGDDANVTF